MTEQFPIDTSPYTGRPLVTSIAGVDQPLRDVWSRFATALRTDDSPTQDIVRDLQEVIGAVDAQEGDTQNALRDQCRDLLINPPRIEITESTGLRLLWYLGMVLSNTRAYVHRVVAGITADSGHAIEAIQYYHQRVGRTEKQTPIERQAFYESAFNGAFLQGRSHPNHEHRLEYCCNAYFALMRIQGMDCWDDRIQTILDDVNVIEFPSRKDDREHQAILAREKSELVGKLKRAPGERREEFAFAKRVEQGGYYEEAMARWSLLGQEKDVARVFASLEAAQQNGEDFKLQKPHIVGLLLLGRFSEALAAIKCEILPSYDSNLAEELTMYPGDIDGIWASVLRAPCASNVSRSAVLRAAEADPIPHEALLTMLIRTGHFDKAATLACNTEYSILDFCNVVPKDLWKNYQFKNAVQTPLRLILEDTTDVDVLDRLGEIFFEMGLRREAIEAFGKAEVLRREQASNEIEK